MARVMRQIVRAASVHAWGRARACKIEHPINELVRSNTSALLDAEGEGERTEYVLVLVDIIYAGAGGHHLRRCWRTSSTPVLADIIYANEHGKNSWDVLKWDVLKSVRQK